jgi:hypothetical protein
MKLVLLWSAPSSYFVILMFISKQDEILRRAVHQFQGKNWKKIGM